MKDTMWLIRKTLLTTFKSYGSWLLYVGLPVIAIALAFFTRGGEGEIRLSIGIVNEDGNQPLAQDALAFMKRTGSFDLTDIGESEAENRIVSGELAAAVTIPAGFSQRLMDGNPLPVGIATVQGAQIAGYLEAVMNEHIDNVLSAVRASGGDEARFDTIYSAYKEPGFQLSAATVEDRSASHDRSKQSIGYLAILLLFGAANLSGILIKERENRTYLRIASSPIAARSYVLSNIAVNLTVMLAQIVLTWVLLTRVFKVDPGVPLWTALLILGLYSLVAVSLSLAIAAFAKGTFEARSMQNLLFLPTSILAGCMFPIEMMPAAIQKIGYFLPQYWLLDSFGSLQQGASLGSLYPNLLILFAFALTLSLVTVYKLGRNNDTRSYL